MAHMIRYSSVSFVVLLVCACGDGESRKHVSSSGGMTSISSYAGGVSIAGESSVAGRSDGGSVSSDGGTTSSAGATVVASQSGSGGVFAGGGSSGTSQIGGGKSAGGTSGSIADGGIVSSGGTASGGKNFSGGVQTTGGVKTSGGASSSVAGGGSVSTGGVKATGGTITVPCTTPLCRCASSVAGSAGSSQSSSLMSVASLTDYSTLGYANYLKSQSGFGLYCSGGTSTSYRTATIGVSLGTGADSEVDTTYTFVKSGLTTSQCDCYYIFNDWFSLRRQFSNTQNFCESTGVALDLKGDISKPQLEAGLRITIVDTACKNADGTPAPLPDGGAYPDELWWYDITQAQVVASWANLQIPFSQFRLGTSRTNDRLLDPRCIVAFEINYQYDVDIWCGNGCSANTVTNGSGHFEIRNLNVY